MKTYFETMKAYTETDTHIFFYGSYLSNFYEAPFFANVSGGYDKFQFYTSEQYFMAAKAMFFKDEEILEKILLSSEPYVAKMLGRSIKSFDAKAWDIPSKTFMLKACLHKFEQNADIRHDLLNTGHKILVEASPTDQIWGIGLGEDDKRIFDPTQWRGENRLGQVLMDVRNNLKG